MIVDDGIYTGNFRRATFSAKYPVKCFAKTTPKTDKVVTYISNNHLVGNGRIDSTFEALNPKEIVFNRFNTHLNKEMIYVVTQTQYCKEGYSNYGDSCYKLGGPATYTEAKSKCKADGKKLNPGGLVQITSFNEMKFLFKNIVPSNVDEFWLDQMSTTLKDEVSTVVALTQRSNRRIGFNWDEVNKQEIRARSFTSINRKNLDEVAPDIIRQQYANLKTGLARLRRRSNYKRRRRKRSAYKFIEENGFLRAADTECSYQGMQ